VPYYARSWGQRFSMYLEESTGIYRVNTLGRFNLCDRVGTLLAQAEQEEFSSRFGRLAQSVFCLITGRA